MNNSGDYANEGHKVETTKSDGVFIEGNSGMPANQNFGSSEDHPNTAHRTPCVFVCETHGVLLKQLAIVFSDELTT